MHTAKTTLLSALAGITTTRVAQMISDFGVNDMLRPLGLARRRSPWPQNLAYLGVGVVIGGVSALLLAPSSGAETRAKLAKKTEELGAAASKQVRELGEQARDEIEALRPGTGNNQPSALTDV